VINVMFAVTSKYFWALARYSICSRKCKRN